jgi:hypothetical protein
MGADPHLRNPAAEDSDLFLVITSFNGLPDQVRQ